MIVSLGINSFFYFAGHGWQVPDLNGDEEDGFDEVILPMDFVELHAQERGSGVIVDDDIHQMMVLPLTKGCQLTAISDCCHSGTNLDLRYGYTYDPKLKDVIPVARMRSPISPIAGSFSSVRSPKSPESLSRSFSYSSRVMSPRRQSTGQLPPISGLVVSWSACQDEELAQETPKSGGVMTYIFKKYMDKEESLTYREFLKKISADLRRKIELARKRQKELGLDEKLWTPHQIPMLYCSHPLDLDTQFTF